VRRRPLLPTDFEYGVLNGKVEPGNTIAIAGAGPIGLAAVLTTQFYFPAAIRDRVLLPVRELPLPHLSSVWSCDADAVVSAMDTEVEVIRASRAPAASQRPSLRSRY